MGHHSGFYNDISKGLSLTKQLIYHFNILSANQYNNHITMSLENPEKQNSSTVIMTDNKTGKAILVDPKPRQTIKDHNVSGYMIKTRDAKMTKQPRFEWAKDRVIWPVIISEERPVAYNIAPMKDLIAKGFVNFNILPSNPTAIKFSLAYYSPKNPWLGGNEGFGFVKNLDVVAAFIKLFEKL